MAVEPAGDGAVISVLVRGAPLSFLTGFGAQASLFRALCLLDLMPLSVHFPGSIASPVLGVGFAQGPGSGLTGKPQKHLWFRPLAPPPSDAGYYMAR